MKGIQSCHPDSLTFLRLAMNEQSLSMECTIAKRTFKDKEMNIINDVLLEVLPLKNAFPELVRLLQISLTVAVSTAEYERSFSCLKRIKNYLHTCISKQQVVDLAIEKELAQNLSLDDIVDKFAAEDKNRRITLL